MAKQIPYKIRLHIMSPVHIGCDDVYEPTGFVVDKTAKKLIAFDQLDFVRGLTSTERGKFLTLCEKGTLESIIEIYKFMGSISKPPQGKCVDVANGFLDIYEQTGKLNSRNIAKTKKELNNFQVNRTSYLQNDQSPYIPGSALKGALRTGFLNFLNQKKSQDIDVRDKFAAKNLEKKLLDGGSFESDPFRMLHVSDLMPVGMPETRVCFAVNRKLNRTGGPYQMLEVIRHDNLAVFEGMITIHQPEQGAYIKQPVSTSIDVFTQIAEFFVAEMQNEGQMLSALRIPDNAKSSMQKRFGEQYLKTVFPLRIGRHSGAQCLTIDGARHIKIKNGRPPFQAKATSLWLIGDDPGATSGLLPFGWVALEVLDIDPTAPLWPERTIIAREGQTAAAPIVKVPPSPPERIVWNSATVTWNPGNQTLTAQGDGKKAEVKLAADKSLVPETLHKKLFVKKEAVKADVVVEQQGNSWRVVDIL